MTNYGLTDSPIEKIADESLGLLDYVEALSSFILHCETPMTIAIQGDWGSGKTSMMNMINDQFSRPEHNIETRWFNTWMFAQFQDQDEIPLSLLAAFLDAIGGGEARQLLGKFAKVAQGVAGGMAKTVVDVASGGGGDLVKDVLDRATAIDSASTLKRLKEDIAKEVKALLKKKNADRLVVFIDDLDRLIPERAVEILEIVKIFLDVKQCVYVLAVDYHVVSKGLEQKFGVSAADLKGKSFFDKIIQMPFNLPVAQYDTRRYISRLFGSQFHFAEQDTDLLIRLAGTSIGSNPRSLKRLFNTLQLLKIVAEKKHMLEADSIASREERERLLFAVLCLQLSYEPIYKMLLRDSEKLDSDYFETLTDPARLEADKTKESVIGKHFSEIENQVEAITRFTEFMRFLMEASQLQNSRNQETDEETATLNTAECDLLLNFLSLSSLTSASAGSANVQTGSFRHKVFILDLLEKTLKPKYQAALMEMDTHLAPQISEHWASIGFDFNMGALAFWLGVTWDDSARNIRVSVWDISGGYKKMVGDWFKLHADVLPNMQFHNLNRYEYVDIDMKPLSEEMDAESETRYLNDLREMAIKNFDILIPHLLAFYQGKLPEVSKTERFADRIAARLAEEFLTADGWEVENSLRSLCRWTSISITHSQWNSQIRISLEAEGPFCGSMILGIKNKKWNSEYAPGMKEGVQSASKDLAIGEMVQSNLWWVCFTRLPEPILHLGPHWHFLQAQAKFPFATQAEEDQAIEQITGLFLRFKEIKPLLDQLAASVKE